MDTTNLYKSRQRLKKISLTVATIIIFVSTALSYLLTRSLAKEERKRIEIWAEATNLLSAEYVDENMVNSLILSIIEGNTTIPLIMKYHDSYQIRNLKPPKNTTDLSAFCEKKIKKFAEKNEPITLNVLDERLFVYYGDSRLLRILSWFPLAQLAVIGLFLTVVIFAFAAMQRSEQNKVWVGLSKETAHQLGTPIMSLNGWTEILEETYPENSLIKEIKKDIERLTVVAERFSKIGSRPQLKPIEMNNLLKETVDYIRRRIPRKIHLSYVATGAEGLKCECSPALMQWVVENLCRNAVDAMQEQGDLLIRLHGGDQKVYIDIADSGHGIRKNLQKAIFTPGYTTKKRGWGLGLSLAYRIVSDYHNGRLFILHSEPGKGTTMRIALDKYRPKS